MKNKISIIPITMLVILLIIVLVGCSPFFVGLDDNNTSNNSNQTSSPDNTNNQSSVIAPPANYNITIKQGNPLPEDGYSFPDIVESVEKSVVSIYVADGNRKSAGSAVFYTESETPGTPPLLVTCAHVIDYALTTNINAKIKAIIHDGTEVECKIVGADDEEDLAVLTIDSEDLQSIEGKYSSVKLRPEDSNIRTGETVFAIGNPLGTLGGSVTKGIISGKERVINMDGVSMNLLQIDVAVNQGNSGGALFDIAGNLIGIVNAKSIGEGVEGIGYAIHINDVNRVSQSIITTSGKAEYNNLGYVEGKVRLGVTVQIPKGQTSPYKYVIISLNPYGTVTAYNANVVENDKIIKENDYITSIRKKDEPTPIVFNQLNTLGDFIKTLHVGDQIVITVERPGLVTNQFSVELTMQQYVYGHTP
ncbi:MAG: trypsin-like serine protease [Clostridiales bacterium]|jgi:serine protease Do|nr:trypsin-like serine protease [Clostridiales bacterium]